MVKTLLNNIIFVFLHILQLIQFMLTMANVPHKTKRHLPMIELGPSKQMKSSYEAEHNSDSSQVF